jgi:hypothetical protein
VIKASGRFRDKKIKITTIKGSEKSFNQAQQGKKEVKYPKNQKIFPASGGYCADTLRVF